jgi:dihydroxy-acid dehydratase
LLQVNISEAELDQRRSQWVAKEPRYKRGILAKYAKLVSSSSQGAVTDKNLF